MRSQRVLAEPRHFIFKSNGHDSAEVRLHIGHSGSGKMEGRMEDVAISASSYLLKCSGCGLQSNGTAAACMAG